MEAIVGFGGRWGKTAVIGKEDKVPPIKDCLDTATEVDIDWIGTREGWYWEESGILIIPASIISKYSKKLLYFGCGGRFQIIWEGFLGIGGSKESEFNRALKIRSS